MHCKNGPTDSQTADAHGQPDLLTPHQTDDCAWDIFRIPFRLRTARTDHNALISIRLITMDACSEARDQQMTTSMTKLLSTAFS